MKSKKRSKSVKELKLTLPLAILEQAIALEVGKALIHKDADKDCAEIITAMLDNSCVMLQINSEDINFVNSRILCEIPSSCNFKICDTSVVTTSEQLQQNKQRATRQTEQKVDSKELDSEYCYDSDDVNHSKYAETDQNIQEGNAALDSAATVNNTARTLRSSKRSIDISSVNEDSENKHQNKEPCKICGLSLHKRALLNHVKRIHQNSEEAEVYIVEMMKNKRKYKREKNIQCRMCLSWFTSAALLRGHVIQNHSENTEYVKELKDMKETCPVCHKSVSHVKYHMERVHNETFGNFPCDICNAVYRSERLLKEHKNRVHNKKERHLCHLCPSSFKHPQYLQDHIRSVHVHNKHFECDICQKVLTSSKILLKHKKIHSGIKPHQCPHCDKCFSEGPNMRRHIRLIHQSDHVNRIQCSDCQKTFTSKSNLKQHVNAVHLQNFQHKCTICKKGFQRKAKLYEHLKSHEPVCHIFHSVNKLPSGQTVVLSNRPQFQPIQAKPSSDQIPQQLTVEPSTMVGTQDQFIPVHFSQQDLQVDHLLSQSDQNAIPGETIIIQQPNEASTSSVPTLTSDHGQDTVAVTTQDIGELQAKGQDIRFVFIPADNMGQMQYHLN